MHILIKTPFVTDYMLNILAQYMSEKYPCCQVDEVHAEEFPRVICITTPNGWTNFQFCNDVHSWYEPIDVLVNGHWRIAKFTY